MISKELSRKCDSCNRNAIKRLPNTYWACEHHLPISFRKRLLSIIFSPFIVILSPFFVLFLLWGKKNKCDFCNENAIKQRKSILNVCGEHYNGRDIHLIA